VFGVIPCLCSVSTETSPEGLRLGDITLVLGRLTFWNFEKKIHWLIVFHKGLWALLVRPSSPKPPMAMVLVTNRRVFRKLYYQIMPGGT